jgi:glycine betaine/choline ABC-type transport system substrate-binding protein
MIGVGGKVKFDGERQRYTVMAANERFAIMVKPFNARKTYLYSIADLERGVRGRCNLIFGPPCDFSTPDGADEALRMLADREMDVSYRSYKYLSADEIAALTVDGPQP